MIHRAIGMTPFDDTQSYRAIGMKPFDDTQSYRYDTL